MIVTDNLASGQGEPRCKEDGRSLHDVGIPAQRRDTGPEAGGPSQHLHDARETGCREQPPDAPVEALRDMYG